MEKGRSVEVLFSPIIITTLLPESSPYLARLLVYTLLHIMDVQLATKINKNSDFKGAANSSLCFYVLDIYNKSLQMVHFKIPRQTRLPH